MRLDQGFLALVARIGFDGTTLRPSSRWLYHPTPVHRTGTAFDHLRRVRLVTSRQLPSLPVTDTRWASPGLPFESTVGATSWLDVRVVFRPGKTHPQSLIFHSLDNNCHDRYQS